MWWTSSGGRVLKGAEWDLFREGLDDLWDAIELGIEIDDPHEVGLAAFDGLQPGQQLAMLAHVGRALRDEEAPYPDLTAHEEATVAAVYRTVAWAVEAEVEAAGDPEGGREDPTFWRRLILAADRHCEEVREEHERELLAKCESAAPVEPRPEGHAYEAEDAEDEGDDDAPSGPPAPDSDDAEQWGYVIDDIARTILWDEDYKDADAFVDAPPEVKEARHERFGIDEDYFTAIAPDPTDAQLEEVRRTLRALCGRPDPPGPRAPA